MATKINAYYLNFEECRPTKKKTWTASDDEQKLRDELDRIYSIRNGKGSKDAVKAIFVHLFKAFEYVTTPPPNGFGFNPMKLTVEHIHVAAEKNANMFEPELTEMSIEYGDWFAMSCEKRLAFKVVGFVREYSKLMSSPEARAHVARMQEMARRAAAANAAQAPGDGSEAPPADPNADL